MKERTACPLPASEGRLSMGQIMRTFAALGPAYWLKVLGITAGAALLIGLPTRLIPNPIFVRMIPTTPVDYVIFAISVVLMGLTLALPQRTAHPGAEKQSLLGGLGTFLAVGCPTCNKLVLLLLGSGGALNYFAPLQPILGVGAIFLVVAALYRRLGQIPPAHS